jgi:predicted nucleic acid-binding protein
MIALDKITQSPSVDVEHASDGHLRRARSWLDELSDQVVALTDAVSFAIMEASRCRVALTFDRDFWIAGFERYDGVQHVR